jgi:nucleotide-binding universal stress UspA family protein
MENFSVLVATDFSQNSKIVLHKAIFLAKENNWKIKILHVVEDTFFRASVDFNQAKINCQNFLAKHFPTIDLEDLYIKQGDTANETVLLAKEIDAKLIIIGASGENFSLERLVLGSTTKKIIRSLEVPVLVVKNNKEKLYKNILMPTDFSDNSLVAVKDTFEIFPSGLVTLLHVYSVPFESRLNLYGIDKEHANSFASSIAQENLRDGNQFIEKLDGYKNKIFLDIKNDVLAPEYFTDNEWLDGVDLISLHTTGQISFFTFDMLERSIKDVLIFKE